MSSLQHPNPRGQRPPSSFSVTQFSRNRTAPAPLLPVNASVGQAKVAGNYGYTSIDNGNGVPLSGVNAKGERVAFINGKPPEQITEEQTAAATNLSNQQAAQERRDQLARANGLVQSHARFDERGTLIGGINAKTGETVSMVNGKLTGDGRYNPDLLQRLQGGQPSTGAAASTSSTGSAMGVLDTTTQAVRPVATPASSPAPQAGFDDATMNRLNTPVAPAATAISSTVPQPRTLAQAMTPSAPMAQQMRDVAAAQPAIAPPAPYGTTALNVPRPAAIQVAPGTALSVANGRTVQGGTGGAAVVPIAPRTPGGTSGVAVGQFNVSDDVPSYIGGENGRHFVGPDEAARNTRLGGTAGSLPAGSPLIANVSTPAAPARMNVPTPSNSTVSPGAILPATNFPPASTGGLDTNIATPGLSLSTGVSVPNQVGIHAPTETGFETGSPMALKVPAPLGNPGFGGTFNSNPDYASGKGGPGTFTSGITATRDFAKPTTPEGLEIMATAPKGTNVPRPSGVQPPTMDNLFTGTGYKAPASAVPAMEQQTKRDEEEERKARQRVNESPLG